MPELPEVQTVVNDLNKYLVGYKISKVFIYPKYKKINPASLRFKKLLSGKIVGGVKRVSKNIIVKLNSGSFLLIHLGMGGRIFLLSPNSPNDKWTRVSFILTKGRDKKKLLFSDTRMFGKVAFISKKELELLKNKYGPDPTQLDLTSKDFHQIIQNKKTIIKNVLMNQEIISGLGNIYATDALFLSKIHPQTPANKINLALAKTLLDSVRKVLEEGIKNRGSTLTDKAYLDILGNEGSHQNHFKIYLKQTCPVCKTKVSYIKISGRGTYFCSNCQKLE